MISPWIRNPSRRRPLAAVALVFLATAGRASEPLPDDKDRFDHPLDEAVATMVRAVPVARDALPRLSTLARVAPAQLGFGSADIAQKAVLASPLRQFTVGLSQLRQLGNGTSMTSVTPLKASPRVLFPVLVEGRAVSSITVGTTSRSELKAVEYGSPHLIQLIEHTAAILARPLEQRVKDPGVAIPPSPELPGPPLPQLGNVGHDYFLVRVPAFNIYFLGERSGSALFLTPVLDDPRVGLHAGITQRAEPGLVALARVAKTMNVDKPR